MYTTRLILTTFLCESGTVFAGRCIVSRKHTGTYKTVCLDYAQKTVARTKDVRTYVYFCFFIMNTCEKCGAQSAEITTKKQFEITIHLFHTAYLQVQALE
jgi:hypothetical protein